MREQKTFEILLHVSGNNLVTVLEVVNDCADIISTKLLEHSPKQATTRAFHGRRFNGRASPRGTTTKKILLDILADGKVHKKEELQRRFEEKGFAAASVSPASSTLIKEGKIKQVATGCYSL